jgi:hypothetical protein
MSIVPTGLPAFTRTADITQYGGHPNKANYQSLGTVNPRTDISAEGLARMTADLAAVVRVMPFAQILYTCQDAFPGAPLITAALLQTGITLVQYTGDDPPTGFPSAARNGDGDVTFTFASSYSDDYAIASAFSVTHATASPNGSGNLVVTPEYTVGGSTVRVRSFTADTGAAAADTSCILTVW